MSRGQRLRCLQRLLVNPCPRFRAYLVRSGLFKSAYGAEQMRPKHHYVLHLPIQLAKHGFLVATMTMERKHRVLKRYLRPRRALLSFEAGCMEEITCYELWQLSDEAATLSSELRSP